MGARLAALFIAALSGLTMAFQGTLNTFLSRYIGLLEATLAVHLVGLAFVSLLLFGFNLGEGKLALFARAPYYSYLGGILSVIIVIGVMKSIPKVGVAAATTAIILGQVLTAGMIDHTGLFGMEKLSFNWCRALGTVFMAGGAWLILHK